MGKLRIMSHNVWKCDNNLPAWEMRGEDCSAIVSFSEFGDGVISANMSFVKNGDKDNVFMKEITSTVGEDGVKIAKAKY